MYPSDWLHQVRAPFGKVLVRRDEAYAHIESIIVPETARKIKLATGTIIASSAETFAPGDRVLLSPGAARRLEFGDDETSKVIVHAVTPLQIIGRMFSDVDILEGQPIQIRGMQSVENLYYIRRDDADAGVAYPARRDG